MKIVEFEKGDEVTFQAYATNEPIKRTVLTVFDEYFHGRIVDHVHYALGYYDKDGKPVITNQTTGFSIQESKLFNLSWNLEQTK